MSKDTDQFFTPIIETVANIGEGLGSWTEDSFKDEVTINTASPAFIRANAGPLANKFLDAVPQDYYERVARNKLYPVVSVRVIRFMKGVALNTPDWHVDADWQLALIKNPYDSVSVEQHRHLLGACSSVPTGIGNTLFWKEPVAVPFTGDDKALQAQIDEASRHLAEIETPDSYVEAEEGVLTSFNAMTFHRCQYAREEGIRLFFRMNMWPTFSENPTVSPISTHTADTPAWEGY